MFPHIFPLTSFHQIPENLTREEHVCLQVLPHSTFFFSFCIVIGNTFSFMEAQIPSPPHVWEQHPHLVLHLWCMTRLTILHLLGSTVWVTRAVQKSWLWQQKSLHAFFPHLCCCFLFSPVQPSCLSSSVCDVGSRCNWQVSGLDRVSTPGPFTNTQHTGTCPHTLTLFHWSCLLFYFQYEWTQGVAGVDAVDRVWIVALAEIEWPYLKTSWRALLGCYEVCSLSDLHWSTRVGGGWGEAVVGLSPSYLSLLFPPYPSPLTNTRFSLSKIPFFFFQATLPAVWLDHMKVASAHEEGALILFVLYFINVSASRRVSMLCILTSAPGCLENDWQDKCTAAFSAH